jgi:hypothetical protein
MFIDAVQFLLTRPADSNQRNEGGQVSVRFRMNTFDLSEDFVPVWLHGPKLSDGDSFFDTEDGNNFATRDPADGTGYLNVGHYRWVLPKPMYVPPGGALRPIFRRDFNTAGDISVNVAYSGRVIMDDGLSRESNIPFIGVFNPSDATITAQGGVVQSDAKNLFNPFNRPLRVQRFLARLRNGPDTIDAVNDVTRISGQLVTLRMQDSMGYDVIKNATPIMEAIDVNRRAWTFSRDLSPKEWFLAEFRGATIARAPQMAMMGYRKEVV